jgi:predicted Zn-dependent peptidase
MNSILFQEMREANGLTYSADAKLVEPDFKNGFYSYYAQISTQTEKLEEAHLHLAEIIDNMPLSESAFENAKHALLNRLRTQRTVRADVLWSYLDAQDVELTEDPNKQIFEQVQQLTLQDLFDFQQKYFKYLKYSHAVLGDPKLLVLKTFEEEGKVVRLTVDDIFGW